MAKFPVDVAKRRSRAEGSRDRKGRLAGGGAAGRQTDSATAIPAGDLRSRLITFDDHAARPRQIEAARRQIDRLVQELYRLTDEEIRLVEEATGH